jgi:hypothetical protein
VETEKKPLQLVAATTKPVYASSGVQVLLASFKVEELAKLENKVTEAHELRLLKYGEAKLRGQHGSPSDRDSDFDEKKKKKSKKTVNADQIPTKKRRSAAEMKLVRLDAAKKLLEVAHTRTHTRIYMYTQT